MRKLLGFILSKINLLILVAAMFAIIAFFMFSVNDLMKIDQARHTLFRLTEKTSAIMNSPLYCDSDFYYFQDYIKVAGEEMFYKVYISYLEAEDGESNYVIFSMSKRKDNQIFARNSFKTTAEVFLFTNLDPDSGDYLPRLELVNPGGAPDSLVIDPQAETPQNAIVIIKQVKEGETSLFIIPCNRRAEMCDLAVDDAKELMIIKGVFDEMEEFECVASRVSGSTTN